MRLTILHGDNLIASRKQLNILVTKTKAEGMTEVVHVDGIETEVAEVIQALESQSLFGSDRLVVIEKLLSQKDSKKKQEIVDYLINQKIETSCIIWEPKELTPKMLRGFSKAKIQVFKTPAIIFKFLDSLRPDNKKQAIELLDQSIKADSTEMVFYMLVRQVKLLLQISKPNLLKLASWQVGKLKRQAQQLGEKKLIELHQKLLEIDERIKTGQSVHGLEGELDLLIACL